MASCNGKNGFILSGDVQTPDGRERQAVARATRRATDEAEEAANTADELEVELTQTHMIQKPIMRVEVGALDARQVKNVKGGIR